MDPLKYARVERERRFLLPAVPPGPFARSVRSIDRYILGTRLRLREMVDMATSTSVYKLTQKIPASADTPPLITTMYLTVHVGLVLAEAECDDEAAWRGLQVPSGWIDVTEDPRYAGATLAAS